MAKRLKETTITKYTNKQILKHLDRLLDLFDDAPFRIDEVHGRIYILSSRKDTYLYFCCFWNRENILNALDTTYRKLGL